MFFTQKRYSNKVFSLILTRQELVWQNTMGTKFCMLTAYFTRLFSFCRTIHTGQFMEVGLSPTSSGASHRKFCSLMERLFKFCGLPYQTSDKPLVPLGRR
jgi:hypothetical protein